MRLRRLEFAVIALTLAFICFMGGYFTGRKGAVNIVNIEPRQNETQSNNQSINAPAAAIPEKSGQTQTNAAQTPAANGDTQGSGESSNTSGTADTQDTTGTQDTTDTADTVQQQETVGAPKGGDGKININLATQSELMDLPGIGSVLAARIVDYRRQYGEFGRIDDLRKVSGIGDKKFEAIADKITVG